MSRQELLFTKVKYDGAKMRLEYQVTRPRGGEPDEFTYVCSDRPRRAFGDALQALALDTCSICEFPSSEAQKIVVRGAAFGWKDGVMGACITALRSLTTADAPLVLNTPFLREAPRESDLEGCRLPLATVRRLKVLLVEAGRYLDGERASGDLLEGPDA